MLGERGRVSSGAQERKQEAAGHNGARKPDAGSGVGEAGSLGALAMPRVVSGSPFHPDSLAFSGFSCAERTGALAKQRTVRGRTAPTPPSPAVVVARAAPRAWVPRRQPLTQGREGRACWGGGAPLVGGGCSAHGHDRGCSRPHRSSGLGGCRSHPQLGRRGLRACPPADASGLQRSERTLGPGVSPGVW